jgi:ketosteroid isomerase-like protein
MPRPSDVVREQFELANRRDYVAADALFTDDVQLAVPQAMFLNGGVFSGRRAVGRWFRDWFTTFSDTQHFDVRETEEAGDAVVVVAQHSARGGSSGVDVEVDLFYVYRVRDGRICAIEFHADREQARAAAGL